jgi:hypothetical protein
MTFLINFCVRAPIIVAGSLVAASLLSACQDGPDSGVAVKPIIAAADYTAAAGPAFHIQSGAIAPLNCQGPTDSSYQWVIESNSSLPIELSSDNTAKSGFTAPIVQAPTPIALVCRMTVTNSVAATATSVASTASTVVTSRLVVTIDPLETAATLVTTISGNKTANPGSRLSLTANSAWYDAKAAVTAGPLINYVWTLGAGAPTGTVITPATGSSLVDVIVPTGIADAVFFPVTVTTTSGTKTTSATVTVLVDPSGAVNLAITPQAQSVQSGAVVSMNATSGTKLFYQWTVVSGPSVSLGGAATNQVGFVAPRVTVATNMVLRVAIGYAPITTANPGIYFLEGVVTVNP